MPTELVNKPKAILFDLYGTLLDMSDLERKLNKIFNNNKGYTLWLTVLMQYTIMDNCIGRFNEFTAVAKATLRMTAKKMRVEVTEEKLDDALELFKYLPLHEETIESLSLLQDQGYVLGVLTNASTRIVDERMERTGLVSYFDTVISCDQIKKYKPDIVTYKYAARKMEVEPADMLMVASPAWDIYGAGAAGLKTAFMERDDEGLYPLAAEPTITINSLGHLAQVLSELPDA